MRLSKTLAIEIVAIAVLLLALRGGILGWSLAAVVLLVAIGLGVPINGMTTLQRITRRRRFRARGAAVSSGKNLPVGLRELGRWVPDLSITQTRSSRGDDVGVLSDGQSWTAWLGLVSDDAVLQDSTRKITLSDLRGLTHQDDISFANLQVIDLVVPAPSQVMLPSGSVAIESYSQILGSPDMPPALHRTWIGVRLDPRLCLEAIGTRGAGDDGSYATLRFGLHRVQSALKRQGIITRELNAHQITDVLAMTAGITGEQAEIGTTEHWDHWSCEGFEQAGRGITSWGESPQDSRDQLLSQLCRLPIVLGISSYTLDSRDHPSGAVRVIAASKVAAVGAIQELAKRCPTIDFAVTGGDQIPVLLGTLPLGREVAA